MILLMRIRPDSYADAIKGGVVWLGDIWIFTGTKTMDIFAQVDYIRNGSKLTDQRE